MEQKLIKEISNEVAYIWINRPEKKNAMDFDVWFGIACVAVMTSCTHVRLSRALVSEDSMSVSMAMRGRWRAGCGAVRRLRARVRVSRPASEELSSSTRTDTLCSPTPLCTRVGRSAGRTDRDAHHADATNAASTAAAEQISEDAAECRSRSASWRLGHRHLGAECSCHWLDPHLRGDGRGS